MILFELKMKCKWAQMAKPKRAEKSLNDKWTQMSLNVLKF